MDSNKILSPKNPCTVSECGRTHFNFDILSTFINFLLNITVIAADTSNNISNNISIINFNSSGGGGGGGSSIGASIPSNPKLSWSLEDDADFVLHTQPALAMSAAPVTNSLGSNNHSHAISAIGRPANVSDVTEFFKSTVKALYIYAVPIICVLGIVGDGISFSVFVFTSFRYQPCSQYLAALSLVDTLFLISQLISSLMTFFPVLALAPGSCSVMVFLSYVCSCLSAWFVVLMMVERYLVVCHPFRASIIRSKRKALAVISALTVSAILLYCHSFFTTVSKNGHRCQVDVKYYSFVLIFTYVDSFLTFVIPFLFIVILNLRIICTVRKFRLRQSLIHRSIYRSQRYHNADKTLSLAQVRSTKMLLRVSSLFVILYMPSYAIRLYGMLLQQLAGDSVDADTSLRLLIAQQLCHVLYYVNFAVDFLVFCLTSSNFRRYVSRCFRSRSGCKYRYC